MRERNLAPHPPLLLMWRSLPPLLWRMRTRVAGISGNVRMWRNARPGSGHVYPAKCASTVRFDAQNLRRLHDYAQDSKRPVELSRQSDRRQLNTPSHRDSASAVKDALTSARRIRGTNSTRSKSKKQGVPTGTSRHRINSSQTGRQVANMFQFLIS